jgi:hypothetical protein
VFFAALAQRHRRDAISDQTGKRAIAVPKIEVVRIGLRGSSPSPAIQEHKLLGPLHGQRSEQEVIESAEGSGGGADGQGERDNRYDRESGSSAKTTEGDAEVLDNVIYGHYLL